jgi:hypothetical protein
LLLPVKSQIPVTRRGKSGAWVDDMYLDWECSGGTAIQLHKAKHWLESFAVNKKPRISFKDEDPKDSHSLQQGAKSVRYPCPIATLLWTLSGWTSFSGNSASAGADKEGHSKDERFLFVKETVAKSTRGIEPDTLWGLGVSLAQGVFSSRTGNGCRCLGT